ncbi:alpha/beta hydrolase family protein [Streptomyces fractus]|uniref:alpha/beta hydrolase family protein n=1 Tax=Streptomyces fractus TaxID=641806 RepID=UPI003CF1B01B
MDTSNTSGALDAAPPVVSVKPIVLPAPHHDGGLRARVTAPVSGRGLPVVLLSHGFGSSLEGYGPLVDHWAAHGFVVVQPTHLDSRTLGLAAGDPRGPRTWRYRVEDMGIVLDRLSVLEASVPGLRGRLDRRRIAVAGHSFGGQTAGMLLGLRVGDPETGVAQDLADPRVRAGVLLATAGSGGDSLTPFAAENLPWLRHPDFTRMTAPALIVAGDKDELPLTVPDAEWTTDPYRLSPGDKSLLTLYGAEHFLGGVSGYEVAETTDENPARVALVQAVTTAYLRHALGLGSSDWASAGTELAEGAHPLGRLESKGPSETPS